MYVTLTRTNIMPAQKRVVSLDSSDEDAAPPPKKKAPAKKAAAPKKAAPKKTTPPKKSKAKGSDSDNSMDVSAAFRLQVLASMSRIHILFFPI